MDSADQSWMGNKPPTPDPYMLLENVESSATESAYESNEAESPDHSVAHSMPPQLQIINRPLPIYSNSNSMSASTVVTSQKCTDTQPTSSVCSRPTPQWEYFETPKYTGYFVNSAYAIYLQNEMIKSQKELIEAQRLQMDVMEVYKEQLLKDQQLFITEGRVLKQQNNEKYSTYQTAYNNYQNTYQKRLTIEQQLTEVKLRHQFLEQQKQQQQPQQQQQQHQQQQQFTARYDEFQNSN